MIAETSASAGIAVFVARTCAASNVPVKLDDAAAIEQIAALLRPDATRNPTLANAGSVQVVSEDSTSTSPRALTRERGS